MLKILQPFLGGILQTSHRSSHTSMIFSATPTASRNNGTGIKDAADCSTTKACFPVAMIYCAVVGTTSRGFSVDFWIQMCVREKAGYESILSPPPWNLSPQFGPPQKYTPSLPRRLLVRYQAVPGRRCGLAERDGRIRINPLTAALEFDSITRSSTEVHSFVAETIATSSCSGISWMQLIVKKFAQFDLMLVTHLRFRLRSFKFPRHEQRTP